MPSRAQLPLSPDRALVDPAEDRLGYAPFAKQLARSILRGCPADGLVVALYGPWGTGKSTALNFILHFMETDPDAEAPVVVRFNPWWFAGQEDLVRRFFKQFEAALFKAKAGRRKLLKKLSLFSTAVSELPIPYAGTAAKAAKAALASIQETDVAELKNELVAELARDATRIVVVIDDIDRLAPDEIRQLFKVVKAIADFPNVIYLLAFDRTVVARALERAEGGAGDEYLEKIVQVPFTLPEPDRVQLQSILFERLDTLFDGTPPDIFDRQYWGNVYIDGISPFIGKPRDVVRLINALSVTYEAVRGEVNAVDFIAVETLRIFVPSAYEIIRANESMFTLGEYVSGGREEREVERRFHEGWLGGLGDKRAPVEKLVRRLFPRLESVWGNVTYGRSSKTDWRKRLRLCSPEVFPIYFRLGVPAGEVSAADVRAAISDAADAKAFAKRLLALSEEKRADGHTRASALLARMIDYSEKEIRDDVIENIIGALFDVGDDLLRTGKAGGGLLAYGDDFRIGWLVHPLLKRLPTDRRPVVLKSAVECGAALVIMVRELVYMRRQHDEQHEVVPEGERLVATTDLDVLEQALLSRIRAATESGALWSSVSPTVLLDAWSKWGDPNEMRAAVGSRLADDSALIKFLGLLVSHVHSHGPTDRVSRITVELDPLRVEDFTDIDVASDRVEKLRARKDLSEDDRIVLDAFIRGRKARKAGMDPRIVGDIDDDDS